MDTQVLIVGAGPTGLALACQCLRLGLVVRLIDKKGGPSATSKAIGLQYRVSEILACMGVVDRFLAQSGSPTTVNLYAKSRRLISLQFRADGHDSGRGAFSPKPLMIAQSDTEALLGGVVRERGGSIEWHTELVGLMQAEQAVIAQLRLADGNEERVRCDWLVSCEGAHSVARKVVGIAFGGKRYPLSFLMADVELQGDIAPAENHVWMHPDGTFAALPFAQKDRWRLFIEVTRQPEQGSANLDLEVIRKLMRERVGDARIRISDPTWISPFNINCRMVDRYRNGRVLLAGDAAHIHSPTGGQGIATGIQDASNLAWKLARVIDGAPVELLDTYEEERGAHAQEVLRETDRTTTLLFAPTAATRVMRDWIVLPLLRSAWVQRRMFAKLSQLHVHYRLSRLSRDDRSSWLRYGGLRAGDRAPDFLLQREVEAAGTSLFELLSGAMPVVLIGPGRVARSRIEALLKFLRSLSIDAWVIADPQAATWRAHARGLTDVHDELERLYGLRGEFLCLVRPDDHIGLIQAPIDVTALCDYLRQLAPAARLHLPATTT